MDVRKETTTLLGKLGVAETAFTGGDMQVQSPVTGEQIGAVTTISAAEPAQAVECADAAFRAWRLVPARDPQATYDLPDAVWAEADVAAAAAALRQVAGDTALRHLPPARLPVPDYRAALAG